VALGDQVRSGAHRYRALVALPEARWPLVASIAGSMPIGMFGLAILLLVRDAHGSFAVAGRVVGAFGVANALGAVAQGRLMDRFGQPRVLRRAAAVHVSMLVVLVVAATREAPSWVLALCALGAGGSLPQVPAAMRSLWSAIVEDEDSRQTAYALVTIVFEVSVVTAPVLTAAIAAIASPAAAVLTAAAVGGTGALAFSATAASRRWRGVPHEVGPLGPLHAAGVRTLFLVLVAFGTSIGVLQVALPAFADDRGAAEAGGLYLAALSAGSLCGGLVYGARRWPGTPSQRLATCMLCIAGGCLLIAAATVPATVGGAALAVGLVFAPTTVVCSALLDTVAPRGTVTEAFAVTVMGIVVGTAIGNAVGGAIVDSASYRTAGIAAAGIAAVGAASGWARRRTLLRATA
jgi:MFS family permease